MEDAPFASRLIGACRIELVLGNIVEQQADAIVNAANTQLSGGGGVDGAIHRAAGKALKEACQQLPTDEKGQRCPTGEVRVTEAGRLHAKIVIHAVGPFYNERYGEKADHQLRQLHENILDAAVEHDCRSVALPAISTGAYRFPIDRAASIAVKAVIEYLKKNGKPDVVRFVLFKQAQFDTFQQALEEVTPAMDQEPNAPGKSTQQR